MLLGIAGLDAVCAETRARPLKAEIKALLYILTDNERNCVFLHVEGKADKRVKDEEGSRGGK